MNFTKPLSHSAEPDFTQPATPEAIELEDEEQPDFSKPAKPEANKAKAHEARAEPQAEDEDEDEEQPKRTRRKRARNTEPKPANYIRTINTADWKQQQANQFKRAYLGY